jgi:hypothetical protein
MATAEIVHLIDRAHVLLVHGLEVGPVFDSPAAALAFLRDYLCGGAQ